MPHQGYQTLVAGAGGVPLADASQYWIRRQTGSTDMTDGTDTNCYIYGGWSQGSTQASNTMSSGTQSFPGIGEEKCDCITINLTHTHPLATTYKLTALSLGTCTNSILDSNESAVMIGIFTGTTAGASILYEKTYPQANFVMWGTHPNDATGTYWSRPSGATTYAIPSTGDDSVALPDLDFGTTYTIGWGWDGNMEGFTANRTYATSTTRTITTSSGDISATFGTPSFGGSAPWDTSNGTTSSYGQIPIIGISAN